MLNLNDFAKEITLQEGKKKSLSIAQVKEVMRLVLQRLAALPVTEADKILNRYR